jgi:Amt family ammonium transporter
MQSSLKIEAGDTAWMLASTALVMLMTPALAMFYGGMVRRRNVLSVFMHSFLAMGLISVQWAVVGYSLVFGETRAGVIGGWNFAFLAGVGIESKGGIPHALFMMYQGMFAVITPALICGAFAERIKLSSCCLFLVLWTTLVYDPIAHWVWGPGGWLSGLGALDFAGGTVVHLSSGVSALVAALVIGWRLNYRGAPHAPHNLPMAVVGAALLWFGWFGFNGGSALGSNGLAALAFVNTHMAAAAATVSWGACDLLRHRKVTSLGVASGAVAGLVGITPAAGFVGPIDALAIGLAAGAVCYAGVLLKGKLGYDDTLDVFGVHGVGGAIGALLTGVFASRALNPSGADGVIAGRPDLLLTQLLSVVVVAAYAGGVSFLILKGIDAVLGLRVKTEEEHSGLDTSLHGERGYSFTSRFPRKEPAGVDR